MTRYRGLSPRAAAIAFLVDRVRPAVADMDLEAIRKARATVIPTTGPMRALTGGVVQGVRITVGRAAARDGYAVGLRIYRPDRLAARSDVPLVMWFHGGGWVLGNVASYDPICSFLADRLDATVVSVDYRLAPEHRAPVAAYDCLDATAWACAHAGDLGIDASRIAVIGDSAGGNLAAVVAQFAPEAGVTGIRHQVLIYPGTDLTKSSPSLIENARAAILDRAAVDAFLDHYLGTGPDAFDPRDPWVSPLFGRLEGLPPALVQTADLDPIRDDGIRYADALRAAGVTVRLTNYLGVPHGFASIPGGVPCGKQHRWEIIAEMRRALAPEGA